MSVVIPPESLRKQLGDEGARDVVETMNSIAATTHEHTVQLVGERFERRLIEVKSDLEKQIIQLGATLTWRMFAFWLAGVTSVLTGILLRK